MRVAERTSEPGCTLLLGEFFEVNEKEDGRRAETTVWQAIEFAEMEHEVMVKGMLHARARVVLGYRTLPGALHTYDTAESSSDADSFMRQDCPELVRVSNCAAWF